MGRRGPAPTPSSILRARGSSRGNRPLEPAPEPAAPPCPGWLEPEAKAYWSELVPELLRLGVLSRIDQKALARYVQTWARWRIADTFIQEHGSTYLIKDDDGNVKCVVQFPQVAIAAKASRDLLRFEQEFGLTPSARARVQGNVKMPPRPTPSPTATPQLKIAQ